MERGNRVGVRWLDRDRERWDIGRALRCESAQHFAKCVFGLRHALACGSQGGCASCMHCVASRVGGADRKRGVVGGCGKRT
ncbi:hypothetical protein [Xanthomonas prunicola]|jgi:hypothetical protein|uniref:hypothetical protein n=1 Tax=Xanthomonas prunicola TaxID=2053930 RepID=UPI001FAF8BF3|nr:hypothetical protein [Xanthomonas prunicola]